MSQPPYGGQSYSPQPGYGAPQQQYPQQPHPQQPHPQQPYPQQPYPQQPGYVQPGYVQPQYPQQFAPQQAYGQPQFPPPGYGDVPPKKSALLWIMVAVCVVVVAIGLTLVLVLKRGNSNSIADPRAVVTSYVDAAKAGNTSKMRGLVCASEKSSAPIGLPADLTKLHQTGVTYSVGAVISQTSTSATVPLTITGPILGESTTTNMELTKEGGDWKICDSNSAPAG